MNENTDHNGDEIYIVINETWAGGEVSASFWELVQEAEKIRDQHGPVTVKEAHRDGCGVVVDNGGEVVAVLKTDYDQYFGK